MEVGSKTIDAINLEQMANKLTPQTTTAKAFLLEELKGGVSKPSDALIEKAESLGISKSTLFRAKDELNVKASKLGFQGAWAWKIPAAEPIHHARSWGGMGAGGCECGGNR